MSTNSIFRVPEPTYTEDGDYLVSDTSSALGACCAALREVVACARAYSADPAAAMRQMEQAARFALREMPD